jgi:hypothetical protein
MADMAALLGWSAIPCDCRPEIHPFAPLLKRYGGERAARCSEEEWFTRRRKGAKMLRKHFGGASAQVVLTLPASNLLMRATP